MTDRLPEVGARLPLSVLIDQMAGDGPRDEHFVRTFSAWFHEHAAHLHLDALEILGLEDVVLTFRMKDDVSLLATGNHPDIPGEITVRFPERDLPRVTVVVEGSPRAVPYEVCTLDYAVAGRPLSLVAPFSHAGTSLAAGTPGRAVVAVTLGDRHQLRAAFDALERPVNLSEETWRWDDEAAS